MISNINPYYKKYLNPNELLYVKIINECPFYIYMGLNYTFKGKRVLKQSPVFATNKSELLTFPSGVSYIGFKIFNCMPNPPQLIYTKVIGSEASSCYRISGPAIGHIQCVEVPC